MATDDLAFYETLAKRGAPAEAALAAYARSHGAKETQALVTRYRHREHFAFERAAAMADRWREFPMVRNDDVGQDYADDAWFALYRIVAHDAETYHELLSQKWLRVARDCDLAPHLPQALCYLWEDEDGVDMRAFLRAKLAMFHLSGEVPVKTMAARLAHDLPIMLKGCADLARLARTPGSTWLPRDWIRTVDRRNRTRESPVLVGTSPYGKHDVPISDDAAEKFARLFAIDTSYPAQYFWLLEPGYDLDDVNYVFKLTPPQLVTSNLELLKRTKPEPLPQDCRHVQDMRRAGLYDADDDVAGCLPERLLGRLERAARGGLVKPPTERWWSRTKLTQELRACKALPTDRRAIEAFWRAIEAIRAESATWAGSWRNGAEPEKDAIGIAYAAALRDLRRGGGPPALVGCTPIALAEWLGKRAHDALPTKDRHTDLGAWVSRAELDDAVATCDLSTDEAAHVRLVWMDLDSAVRSGVSMDARTQAIKDTLHAYRYDRAPWSAAQRRAAREIAAQSMRRV